QLVAPGEEARPVRIGLERIRVEVVGNVDAQVGIIVLVPRPTDVVVLLVDREGNPGLLESDRGAQAAEARSDDPDPKIFDLPAPRSLLPLEAAQVGASERTFFAHERDVGLVDRLAGAELHDLEHDSFVARPGAQLAAPER